MSADYKENTKIGRQSQIFIENDILTQFANAISQMLLILNNKRQIVFANNQFIDFLQIEGYSNIIGLHVGNAVQCIHSHNAKGGCGTSEFCKTCGAVNAILEAIAGTTNEKECRILTTHNTALDIRVTASPFIRGGQHFTIFAIKDINDEKRRKNLEHVFFHDILNSAGGIAGLSEMLQEVEDQEEIKYMANILNRTAQSMIEEIHSQRQISLAESGELKINIDHFNSLDFLEELVHTYTVHHLKNSKTIHIAPASEKSKVATDRVLLRRILYNMVNNALEASPHLSEITLYCSPVQNKTQFAVHNPGTIPKEVQLQIFQRSFSTKGRDRGIGTYSMKLLGEKYLKGKVWFKSSEKEGTTFYLEI